MRGIASRALTCLHVMLEQGTRNYGRTLSFSPGLPQIGLLTCEVFMSGSRL